MELRQLEFFVAVVEEQHFTRAAARVKVSQSALSSSIRSLERELGATLFTRTTRRVTLTPAGAALAVDARRTLAAAADARASVVATGSAVTGRLRLGGIRTASRFDSAGLLARFHKRHPEVAISYVISTSIALIEDVAGGRLDAAFVSLQPPLPSGVESRELVHERVAFVCDARDPFAGRDAVTAAEVADRPFISGPPWSAVQAAVNRVAAPRDDHVRIESNDIHTMLDLVANGLGVAMVPASFAALDSRLRAVPFSDLDLVWRFGIVSLAQELQSAAGRAFLEVVAAEAQSRLGTKKSPDEPSQDG